MRYQCDLYTVVCGWARQALSEALGQVGQFRSETSAGSIWEEKSTRLHFLSETVENIGGELSRSRPITVDGFRQTMEALERDLHTVTGDAWIRVAKRKAFWQWEEVQDQLGPEEGVPKMNTLLDVEW